MIKNENTAMADDRAVLQRLTLDIPKAKHTLLKKASKRSGYSMRTLLMLSIDEILKRDSARAEAQA